jgi:hypothetical protein
VAPVCVKMPIASDRISGRLFDATPYASHTAYPEADSARYDTLTPADDPERRIDLI